VIFTSDNGGLTPKNTSNYPLMGGKSFPFEAGMKVPFIVKWPGKIRPGTSSERIVGMDIYPTMLSAAGLPPRPEQHVDGLDLMPLLTQGVPLKRRPILFHYPHYTHATGPFSSIIEDDWIDPEEQNNMAAKNAKMRDKLSKRLDVLLKGMKAEMPIINPDFKPDEKGRRFHLKSTKDLAKKERILFESRLEQ